MNDQSSTKGIDYILNKSMTNNTEGISGVPRLQGQTICLDNRSNTANSIRLKEHRKETKKNRKYKWQSFTTRKYRNENMKLKKGIFTYEKMDPISKLWTEYATRITPTEQNIARMDLHGATITVISSPDPNLVGVTGRIIKESYGALIVISEDNKYRQINKNHTIAHLQMPQGQTFEINFSTLRCRPCLKVTKKWKQRTPISLPF
ncbi:RNase P/RNase MRP complex subunit [Tritrichomonas musculus]|uniref:RNase P/RNase MRP complex subunit n=1 Tax=Tritrichomonas musculus TaxID=1915356 RepID=A0ABR2KZB6_9EUKA